MKLEITPEKVREAAAKCTVAETTLKALFPEAFDNEPFDFGHEFKITQVDGDTGPLKIGDGSAGERGRYLYVRSRYRVEVNTDALSRTIITLHKK